MIANGAAWLFMGELEMETGASTTKSAFNSGRSEEGCFGRGSLGQAKPFAALWPSALEPELMWRRGSIRKVQQVQ